ncbi:MAG: LuxR C-terminal-related transcriptional regulator [Solimonas sp.]
MQMATELAKYLSKADLINALDLFEAADKAGTEEQFRHIVELTATLIPLERMHVCFATLDEQLKVSGFNRHILINYPADFVNEYLENGYDKTDAAWDILMRTGKPVIWHELRAQHRSPEQLRAYALADSYGLHDGFTFGARFSHLPGTSVFAAICDRRELVRHKRHLAVIEYLTPHLHGALARIQFGLLKETPILTEREREVMNWAKFGKTDWEISLQIGVSARTVKFHIENVMHKLQASNRVQATAIALSQGLIGWG